MIVLARPLPAACHDSAVSIPLASGPKSAEDAALATARCWTNGHGSPLASQSLPEHVMLLDFL